MTGRVLTRQSSTAHAQLCTDTSNPITRLWSTNLHFTAAMLNSSGEANDVSNVAAAEVVKMSAGRSKLFRLGRRRNYMRCQ